jgi:hypothetical protein
MLKRKAFYVGGHMKLSLKHLSLWTVHRGNLGAEGRKAIVFGHAGKFSGVISRKAPESMCVVNYPVTAKLMNGLRVSRTFASLQKSHFVSI